MMNNTSVFQDIFDLIQPLLPGDWNRLVLYVGYTPGSYNIKYYTANIEGIYTDCFNHDIEDRNVLSNLFSKINDLLKNERALLNDKNRWTVMTMIVDTDGNMRTEYDYTDISENSIEYMQNWKKRYLTLSDDDKKAAFVEKVIRDKSTNKKEISIAMEYNAELTQKNYNKAPYDDGVFKIKAGGDLSALLSKVQ